MRDEPIELRLSGPPARRRPTDRTRRSETRLKIKPGAVDEAFAYFDAGDVSCRGHEPGPRLVKQVLVTDLVSQLDILDQQRARLAQLLNSIEASSILD